METDVKVPHKNYDYPPLKVPAYSNKWTSNNKKGTMRSRMEYLQEMTN